MAEVVVRATVPSVQVGLAAMLTQYGHEVIAEGAPESCGAVWVVDLADPVALRWPPVREGADPPLAVVALTDQPGIAPPLAQAGLRGWACLSRDCSAVDLSLAVHAADAGLVLLDQSVAMVALPRPSAVFAEAEVVSLTARELQVLQLIAEGLPNKAIGRALGISENTAKFHVASVSAKLGASSRAEAVAQGIRLGLIVL